MDGNNVVVKMRAVDDVMKLMVVRIVIDNEYLPRWKYTHPSCMSHAEKEL
jgi:hypothetical protein